MYSSRFLPWIQPLRSCDANFRKKNSTAPVQQKKVHYYTEYLFTRYKWFTEAHVQRVRNSANNEFDEGNTRDKKKSASVVVLLTLLLKTNTTIKKHMSLGTTTTPNAGVCTHTSLPNSSVRENSALRLIFHSREIRTHTRVHAPVTTPRHATLT